MLPVLMSEVKELKGVVKTQNHELEQLNVMNTELQKEIQFRRQSLESNTATEQIIKEFALVGESLGWNGWNRYGYRAVDGTLYGDIDAIKSFIDDLKQEYHSLRSNSLRPVHVRRKFIHVPIPEKFAH